MESKKTLFIRSDMTRKEKAAYIDKYLTKKRLAKRTCVIHWQTGTKDNQYAFCGKGRHVAMSPHLKEVMCKLCHKKLEAKS